MNFRWHLFIGLFIFGQFLSGCGHQLNSTRNSSQKPNIVIFIADDLGARDISAYGNKVVRTPHLQTFASEAMLFTNTFAGSPTCGPSRSTLLTGLYPFRHGGHGNHSAVKTGTKSIVQYLKPLGYRVAIAGKLHVGPESSFPFERISKTNVPEPGFEAKPWLRYDLNMENVDKWLSLQKSEEPFALVVADHSPHVIWPDKAEYNPEEIDIPIKHIDTKETRRSRARYYTDITKMDSNFGKLIASLKENGLSENTIIIFTSDQGPQWAFGKWSLYEYGIRTPMMIRWPGKIKPGTSTDVLITQADILPTLVQIGGGPELGQIDGKSFLNVLTGNPYSGREYVFATHTGDHQMNRSPSRMVRSKRYKYILNLAPEIEYNTHMNKATDHDGGREYWPSWIEKARTDKQAAHILDLYHHRPAEELYDLASDPEELKNLAKDGRYVKILNKLRKEISSWRNKQGDRETGPQKVSVKPAGKKDEVPYVFIE